MAVSVLTVPARNLLEALANFEQPFFIAPLEGQPHYITMKEAIIKHGAKQILDEYMNHKSTQARIERGDEAVICIRESRALAEQYLSELVRDPPCFLGGRGK